MCTLTPRGMGRGEGERSHVPPPIIYPIPRAPSPPPLPANSLPTPYPSLYNTAPAGQTSSKIRHLDDMPLSNEWIQQFYTNVSDHKVECKILISTEYECGMIQDLTHLVERERERSLLTIK
jgi:hypothetical protein